MASTSAEKSVELDEEEVEVPDETAVAAQKVVAAYATDAEECVVLLDMLGIGPAVRS